MIDATDLSEDSSEQRNRSLLANTDCTTQRYRKEEIVHELNRLEYRRDTFKKRLSCLRKIEDCIGHVNILLISICVALNSSGLATLKYLATPTTTTWLEGGALVCTILALGVHYITRRVSTEVRVREQTASLAETHLRLSLTLVSKILDDEEVSDAEFATMLAKQEEYSREIAEAMHGYCYKKPPLEL